MQTAQTSFQDGDYLDIFFGTNYLFKNGALKGNRLGVEVGFPVTQDLNGPHLETDFALTVGWQLAF